MKLAILYAGQGAQRAGMGLDMYERFPEFSKRIDEVSDAAGFNLKEAMFGKDDALLMKTEVTQPALAAFATGVTAVLTRHGIVPDAVAGLSLGEYSALSAAGVFDPRTLIALTAFRGQAMARAGEGIDAIMCAVLGLPSETVEAIADEAEKETGALVRVVNYNTTGQDVISGLRPGVKRAEELARAAGCKRCIELKTSSAFHTPFMEPAAKALKEHFPEVHFGKMTTPVFFNATGLPLVEDETISDLLVRQVKSPVRMKQTIFHMKETMGIDAFIEVGPGHALSGFVKRAIDGAETAFINDAQDLEEVLKTYGKS